MRATVRIEDQSGLAVLRDASLEAPDTAGHERLLQRMRSLAQAGAVFFIHGEDGIACTVELLLDEAVPGEVASLFEQVGGTFLLHAPTGQLHLSGHAAWAAHQPAPTLDVPPGSYALVVHSREHFDPALFRAVEEQQVGATEVAYRNRVDRLGLLGCLPTVALPLVFLIRPLRAFTLLALGVAALSWLPRLVLERGRRYRSIKSRLRAFEEALPLFVLQLRRLDSSTGLAGGFVTLS